MAAEKRNSAMSDTMILDELELPDESFEESPMMSAFYERCQANTGGKSSSDECGQQFTALLQAAGYVVLSMVVHHERENNRLRLRLGDTEKLVKFLCEALAESCDACPCGADDLASSFELQVERTLKREAREWAEKLLCSTIDKALEKWDRTCEEQLPSLRSCLPADVLLS